MHNIVTHCKQTFHPAPSQIIVGLFGGRVISSPEQVINILSVSRIPATSMRQSSPGYDPTLQYNTLVSRWMDYLKRYLHGKGSPPGDMIIADAPQDLDPISRARAFLISTTGSEYLPVDRDKRIRVSLLLDVVCNTKPFHC